MSKLAAAMAILAVGSAYAQHSKITVCVEIGNDQPMLVKAEAETSTMLRHAGVLIDWKHTGSSCPLAGIVVHRSDRTPVSFKSGALAYAMPYQGVTIELFMDRIAKEVNKQELHHLVAHVLVHELTHILQGVARHSETGVMKARWGRSDFLDLVYKPLPFTDDDLDLIRVGSAARAARLNSPNPVGN